jgi:hypothetical protein
MLVSLGALFNAEVLVYVQVFRLAVMPAMIKNVGECFRGSYENTNNVYGNYIFRH